jgi:hypothetical protein
MHSVPPSQPPAGKIISIAAVACNVPDPAASHNRRGAAA